MLKNLHEMCQKFLIIDTHIALRGEYTVQHNGQSYEGLRVREHADTDSNEVRRGRLGASVDNPFSFQFTKESLFRLLNYVGFTCVCECIIPLEADKPEDRITIAATKGRRVKLSSYPWVNDKTEDEIKRFLDKLAPRSPSLKPVSEMRQLAISRIQSVLRRFGLEIKRI